MSTVDSISVNDTGVYLITTQGSTHLWNLDEKWYVRNPGVVRENNSELMRGLDGFNGAVLPLDKVEYWPAVGSSFSVRLPPPRNWHVSSKIRSIEKVE